MASGIHLAWGIFRMAPLGHWIISTNSTWAVSFTIVAWFLAANLGGLFSLKAIPALPKKLLYVSGHKAIIVIRHVYVFHQTF